MRPVVWMVFEHEFSEQDVIVIIEVSISLTTTSSTTVVKGFDLIDVG